MKRTSMLILLLLAGVLIFLSLQAATVPAGTLSYTTQVGPVNCATDKLYVYSNWVFTDSTGVKHLFPATDESTYYDPGPCGANEGIPPKTTGFTAISLDGKYSLTAYGSSGTVTFYPPPTATPTPTPIAGKLSYTTMVGPINCSTDKLYIYSDWVYTDIKGAKHPFPIADESSYYPQAICGGVIIPTKTTGFTAISLDGLYKVSVWGSSGTVTSN